MPSFKEHVVRCAAAYAQEHARDVPTTHELCRATGASDRTLERGFRELFGVTPKAYVQAMRLNSARRDLLASDPATAKIADVANEWGFWHMGQFAADYRKMFGELPSQTLRGLGHA